MFTAIEPSGSKTNTDAGWGVVVGIGVVILIMLIAVVVFKSSSSDANVDTGGDAYVNPEFQHGNTTLVVGNTPPTYETTHAHDDAGSGYDGGAGGGKATYADLSEC
jgi:hypothetical protein